MAKQHQSLQSSKKRSHSSPELQINSPSSDAADEHLQRILCELSDLRKDQNENTSQPNPKDKPSVGGAKCSAHNLSEMETLHGGHYADNNSDSPSRRKKIFKGFQKLSTFLGGKTSQQRQSNCKNTNMVPVSHTVTPSVSAENSPDDSCPGTNWKQQRSKSVCSTIFRKIKRVQKPADVSSSSSSDESDTDISALNLSDSDQSAKVTRRKGKGRKDRAKKAMSVGVIKKSIFGHPLSDDEAANNETSNKIHTENSTASACEGETAISSITDTLATNSPNAIVFVNSEIPVVPVPNRGVGRIPITLADMFRNQQELMAHRSAQNAGNSDIPNATIAPFQQVVTTTPSQSQTTQNIYAHYDSLMENGTFSHRTVHTQIDYMHCLVPDQWSIINAPYYWGQIDRFQADALLANRPEGTFVLRDSSQEEFVFSVSFRRYGRTLHARIEQWNHKFTFDAHDPGVHSSKTICGLLEHYKDPALCMFFEPMLTAPLKKRNAQSLQELCRARICSHITYNDIGTLKLPLALREYLEVYHYKQRLRVRRMEVDRCVVDESQPAVVTNTCLSAVHSIVL